MEPVEMKRNETDDCYVFQHPDLFPKAFPIMDEMRSQGTFCDVVLTIEDKSFNAHKIVLASTIPYFQAMFAHGMVETKQENISLQGIDAVAVECLLNFAYSAKLIIHDNNVQSIMLGASFLQLHEAVEACVKFLCKKLDPQNVLSMRQLADTLACGSLLKAVDEYINQNFHDVSLSDEYLNLPLEDVLDIIQRDNLFVVSEEKVFEACMQWVKHCNDRVDCLPRLLAKVRLSLLTPLYLMDKVATEELIKTSIKCRDLLDEAYLYKFIPERRSLLQSFNTVPRTQDYTAAVRYTQQEAQQQAGAVRTPDARLPVIFAVGGENSQDSPVNTVSYLDSRTLIWKEAPKMSVARMNCKVVVCNDKLYAIGGTFDGKSLSAVEVFDPLKKQWANVANMLDKRGNFGATALDQFIYVCGGFLCSVGEELNTVLKYSPQWNSWIKGRSMIKKRCYVAVVACQGYVYALGGDYGNIVVNSVEKYDPATEKWTEATPMLTRRRNFGASELNGKIYACGGRDGGSTLQTVEMFDPVLNKWRFVAPMNTKRCGFTVTANMGKLWVVGCSKEINSLGSIDVYDPVSDSWNLVTPNICSYSFGVGLLSYH